MLKLDKDNPLGTKVQTRDGRKARLICVDRIDPDGYPIIALITEREGLEFYQSYTLYGKASKSAELKVDLINVPEEPEVIKGWFNVYRGAMEFRVYGPYNLREEALRAKGEAVGSFGHYATLELDLTKREVGKEEQALCGQCRFFARGNSELKSECLYIDYKSVRKHVLETTEACYCFESIPEPEKETCGTCINWTGNPLVRGGFPCSLCDTITTSAIHPRCRDYERKST